MDAGTNRSSSGRAAWAVADRQRPQTCSPGSALLSPEVWEAIAHSLKLSGRELQIVRADFDDQTESALAHQLDIAPCTVHTHVERLHRKLGITHRAQLIVRVMQEFLALTASPDNGLPAICANRAAGRCPLER
jgi:DNA-binding NarL/FixJ family response regulator